jgi:hypothetical protein
MSASVANNAADFIFALAVHNSVLKRTQKNAIIHVDARDGLNPRERISALSGVYHGGDQNV